MSSDAILERLKALHPKAIDLSLGRIERLLADLGSPADEAAPGLPRRGNERQRSTCAYLRAMLEASGRKVHAYTSPHLVRFHERIPAGGSLISEDALTLLLDEVGARQRRRPITFFEITTAAAMLAFARIPATRWCSSVAWAGATTRRTWSPIPLVSIVIAGRLRPSGLSRRHADPDRGGEGRDPERARPAVIGPQAEESLAVLDAEAERLGCPLTVWGRDFSAHEERGRMIYQSADALMDFAVAQADRAASDRQRRNGDRGAEGARPAVRFGRRDRDGPEFGRVAGAPCSA